MTDAEKYRGLVGMKEAQKCCIPENVKNGISSLSLSGLEQLVSPMKVGTLHRQWDVVWVCFDVN